MLKTNETDIVVIGGGPAGSTVAALLVKKGHRVVLFEKERFPREAVGESLLPFCHHIFEELGILDEMKRRFVRKPGVRFIDSDGSRSTNWCFRRVIDDESYLSYHVKRSIFDELMLDNAAREGAEVHQEHRVRDVDVDRADGGVEVGYSGPDGREGRCRARFLIDASGRETYLARRMGWKKPNPELIRTAIGSHWEGVRMRGGLEEGLAVICYIGQEKRGWLWILPIGAERLSIGAVMENSYLKSEKARLEAAGSDDWKRDLYLQEIRASPFVSSLLEGAERVLPVMPTGNYSYKVDTQYGPNYALVGDARGFIDPIFSSGVFLSMKSSQLLAGAIDVKLTGGDGDTAMKEAYDRITGAYEFVGRMIRMFYNPHVINWAQLGDAETVLHKSHETAMSAGHYMLAGDFFENHRKYNKFFQTLENETTFKYYNKVVLKRHEESRSKPCGADPEEVYRAFEQAAVP